MAATISANLTDFDLAESATPWSTGTLDADFYVQGNNSVGFYMSKNARGSVTIDATDITWSGYTYPHIYFWLNSAVASKMEAQTTGTTTASGVTIRVTLANSAYREWHVCGSDTWDGGWKCFVVDMNHTGSFLYASSGTWTNSSQIASVTYYLDLSNSGNIRNVPANCWGDAIRVGEGITAYSPDNSTEIDFGDIAAEDKANGYGILQEIDGVYFAQGQITIGDSAGTNYCDFVSQEETVVFAARTGTGAGFVHNSLYELNFTGNSTNPTTADLGIKVGTGDAASGRAGTVITGSGTDAIASVSTAANTTLKMYGSTFKTLSGVVDLSAATASDEYAGCTFSYCGIMDTGSAVMRNCTWANTTPVSGAHTAALRWNTNINVKFSQFLANSDPDGTYAAAGIKHETAGEYNYVSLTFSGNEYDILFDPT